jgi:enamine deaminase RidA (YjgF/YER057c/UK114 family)
MFRTAAEHQDNYRRKYQKIGGEIMQILQPKNWPAPKGYANGIVAKGNMVFLAGQVGWDENEKFPSSDFVEQARQAMRNIITVLAQAGGRPEHIVRMTWFITDKDAYMKSQKRLGAVYREVMGRHYPVMSLLVISALVENGAKLEIEATAVLPEA